MGDSDQGTDATAPSPAARHRTAQARYFRTPKGRETNRRYEDKRVRARRVARISAREAELADFYEGKVHGTQDVR